MSPDWLMTRVIVVALWIATPFYFFLLMFVLPFQITPFGEPLLNILFNNIIVPTVFSVTWVGILYFNRYRISNTIYLLRESTTAVPLRWRVFYGLNAAFVMIFFVMPIISAPIAVIGGLVFAGNMGHAIAVGKFNLGRFAAIITGIIAIALCILPGYIMLAFIPQYLQIWNLMLTTWSTSGFGIVYGIAQCLVNALSIGAPIHFIYFGAQQYEKGLLGTIYTEPPTGRIRLMEALLFIVFTIVYLPPIITPFGVLPFLDMSWVFTTYINWVSLGIVVILIIVKRALGVADSSTLGGASNLTIVVLFLLVEIFFKTNLLIVTLVVWLAFLIFAIITLVNFARASPREMY
ncbi:MAG: hypothetical protein K9W43_05085 [Candidatus Thorarchaeota archaeon]|nr:hypothetical protein [Candidatus Thorarchaeota archaeon]